ncbi:MAG: MFS transporter [Prevotella sp.]|nr:MFS transporter [Prevotella sp.]
MNTQSTAVHIRLWHREFWLMAIANLLLSMAVTMLIPSLPLWLDGSLQMNPTMVGLTMGAFALGLFLPGAFCSFLVQHYRRNMVFILSVLVLAATMAVPLLAPSVLSGRPLLLVAWRVVQGAAFGLSQMVLTSTLIIDTCESHQRTEANHSATWFGRFALSLGPMAGLLLLQAGDFRWVLTAAIVGCALTVLLILCIHFPFRVPEDNVRLVSLDRFFLPNGFPLMLNMMLVTVAVGLMMSMAITVHAYGLVMLGFLLALLAQRFVFRDAELKSEVVAGLLLIGAALLILFSQRHMIPADHSVLPSPLIGLGLGIVGARFLLFFIKLSRHCQRGTSQSTFMLGWESGLALGVGIGYACFAHRHGILLLVALALIVVALLLYVTFTHRWFIKHKNR